MKKIKPLTVDEIIFRTGVRFAVVMKQQGACGMSDWLAICENAGLKPMMCISQDVLAIEPMHEIVMDGKLYRVGSKPPASAVAKAKRLALQHGFFSDALMMEHWPTYYVTEAQ